ncbi:trans-aconitate methyltransferase [uncultured Pleomorphomonas sp.]|uniref:Trans-aconitate methyltransferase n=1 Tax=uncultured Pleomorphomonas sp. TaxID=442121 RepID=A0A212L1L5_9HYPH|nr:trans-aconitate 2-methyltransferase [uncultured Pleomorphomonas sp.]SCM71406.1 trans-aconitate methyltransferase [uncultured Pleomorphomonas sp.]
MADWSPETYLKFEDERTRPARDLLNAVPLAEPSLVIDIGCGPGNSTELLVERFPGARHLGIDTSPAMLAKARARLPGVVFLEADAAGFRPDAPPDLMFANAVFQWLPDHRDVFVRLLGELAPGGVLAVQMPDNIGEPLHALMREVAAGGRWAGKLGGAARAPLPPVRTYYEALKPHCRRLDIWHSVYNHPLADAAAVVEWVRSTGLKPFLDPLDEDEQADFLAAYTQKVAEAYPPLEGGGVLLRFPRLFIVATR